jgi:hypothetical protein
VHGRCITSGARIHIRASFHQQRYHCCIARALQATAHNRKKCFCESDYTLSEDALHQQRYHCCIAGALQATAANT